MNTPFSYNWCLYIGSITFLFCKDKILLYSVIITAEVKCCSHHYPSQRSRPPLICCNNCIPWPFNRKYLSWESSTIEDVWILYQFDKNQDRERPPRIHRGDLQGWLTCDQHVERKKKACSEAHVGPGPLGPAQPEHHFTATLRACKYFLIKYAVGRAAA